MENLFTETIVELSKDFTNSCSAAQLEAKLSRVKAITGVQYTRACDTIVLSGSWEQVNGACDLLADFVKDENHAASNNTTTDEVTGINHTNNIGQMEKKALNGLTEYNHEINGFDWRGKRNSKLNHSKQRKDQACLDSKSQKTYHTELRSRSDVKFLKEIQGTCAVTEAEIKANEVKHNKMDLTSLQSDMENKRNVINMSETDVEGKDNGAEGNELRNGAEGNELITTKCKRKPGEKGYWSRVKIENYNEKHTCSTCGITVKSRKRYMEHMRRIHLKEFECKVCLRGFGYPTDLRRHKCPGFPDPDNTSKSKGGRPKKEKTCELIQIPCQDCDFIGTSKKKLRDHVKRTHRLELSCDICERKFGFVRDLDRHKSNVHSKSYYYCDRCSKKYKSKDVFQLHLKTHEEGYTPLKYPCEVCGKTFTTRYCLNAHHKKEHLGISKVYLCQICGKKFGQRNSYNHHLNAHNRVKPYVCDVCGSAFTYRKSLKEHKYLHDNIRRFKCNICSKSFRQRTPLKTHLKVHKSIKDYICVVCGKGFSQKYALVRHERIHSGFKPYTCIPCQRKFGDASTIRRHMKAIHHKTNLNWREDISCNLRKRNDYYVLGGTGHNRSYKSKLRSENTTTSIININKPSHENTSAATTQEVVSKSDENTVILVPPYELNSSVHKPGCITYTELNNLQTTIQTSDNFQYSSSSGPYCIPTVQQGQNTTTINRANKQGNGQSHGLTCYSWPQSGNEVVAPIGKQKSDKVNPRQLEVQSQYIDLHLNLSTSTNTEQVVEGIEPQRITYQAAKNNPETLLNQNLASLWSMVGYSGNNSNVTHYQGHQTK